MPRSTDPLQAIADLRALQLFRDLLTQAPVDAFVSAREAAWTPGESLAQLLGALAREELLFVDAAYAPLRDPWEAWLVQALLASDNPWARCAERGEEPGELLNEMARRDLSLLSRARGALRSLSDVAGSPLPRSWQSTPRTLPRPRAAERQELIARLAALDDWSLALDDLRAFHRLAGAGPFSDAVAFVWEGSETTVRPGANPECPGRAGFVPVFALDPLRLEQLVGYERERAKVIENTERLIQGLPAHHLLLYGDRGTGKSATVKALVHRYASDGLRLIEVPKSRLASLPQLVRRLEGRGLAYILFIDDLSFEETETEYKELKAFLEGSLRHPPARVRVYATSNRRHLVREFHSDRGALAGDEEVRRQDTLQEKLSLADRFGMTIIFPTPDQSAYLAVVHSLAARYGIDLPAEVLEEKALQWASWYNGRSARSARQFVEWLVGRSG